jgi:dTDP-4-dehydrorhamnose reductase
MLRLKDRGELNVVFDQVGTPTYAGDLAGAILEIVDKHLEKIKNKKAEIYHYSNEGVISWYDFAKAVFEIENINIKVNPIETKDYPTPAKRPHYSVLNKKKIKKEFNIEIPYWRESLRKCLQRIDNG